MARLLLVDDDRALVRTLRIALEARGHEVAVARTGQQALQQAALVQPDAVVLDLGLPDMDGVEVCRQLRQWLSAPVLVLSAADDEQRKVAALDLGADDYVTKPFSMAELQARLRVALRRGNGQLSEPTDLVVGRLHIDLVHRGATVDGQRIDLTARELDLLVYLARHAGKICSHHLLLQAVWGPGYGTETHYLRVYAHRLRRKLGERGPVLRTHAGLGYELVPDPEGDASEAGSRVSPPPP